MVLYIIIFFIDLVYPMFNESYNAIISSVLFVLFLFFLCVCCFIKCIAGYHVITMPFFQSSKYSLTFLYRSLPRQKKSCIRKFKINKSNKSNKVKEKKKKKRGDIYFT